MDLMKEKECGCKRKSWVE